MDKVSLPAISRVVKRTDLISRSRHFRNLLSNDAGSTHLRHDTSSPRYESSPSLPLDARPAQRSSRPPANNLGSSQTFDPPVRNLPRLSPHFPTISAIDS